MATRKILAVPNTLMRMRSLHQIPAPGSPLYNTNGCWRGEWWLDVVSKAIRACEGFESSREIDPYMRVRTEAMGRLGQAKFYNSLSCQQVNSLASFASLTCQDITVTVISVQFIDPLVVTKFVSVRSTDLMSG